MNNYKKACLELASIYGISVTDERFGDGYPYHLVRKENGRISFLPLANKETYDFFKDTLNPKEETKSAVMARFKELEYEPAVAEDKDSISLIKNDKKLKLDTNGVSINNEKITIEELKAIIKGLRMLGADV